VPFLYFISCCLLISFPGLPKALREALQFLASNHEVDLLAATLHEQLIQADPKSQAHTQPAPALNLGSDTPTDLQWSEGVEEFKDLTEDQLWTALGVPNAIPFFNDRLDPTGLHDPWTQEGRTWFRTRENGAQLKPRWYQLGGDMKILRCLFAGLPAMLFDEVGLGKTIQVVSSIAMLAYYRDYFELHKCYPGSFGASLVTIFRLLLIIDASFCSGNAVEIK
jgi:hypothetical protein